MKDSITTGQVREWVMTLYNESEKMITPAERKEQQKYATMVQRHQDKVFLSKMLDESSQIRSNRKLARRIKILIERYGVPEFFSPFDKFLLRMYRDIGYHFDFIAIPIIKARLRSETASVIIDEARPKLTKHLADRTSKNIGQNVNLLGEVVLGNGEADHRYHHYLEALESPDINYISVKISGIYAGINGLSHKKAFTELVERISALYTNAIKYPTADAQGVSSPKFINLDMEEYKDARLTLEVFKAALSKPEFKNYRAGIVIQAYLPDAHEFYLELLEFARARVAAGGAPIKMRLVKGANLEMESVVSSLRGWPNPILSSKTLVDANYLHILDMALERQNAEVVNVGVASHNFFSIAYAYLLSNRNGSSEFVTFEMLEGMANHLWRAQSNLGNRVILYTPVVKDENFLNAVSYLVRRMDENTGPENFLSYSFNLKPDTEAWRFLDKQFEEAYQLKENVPHGSFRTQDRNAPYKEITPEEAFRNEPDTDFDLEPNQRWAEGIIAAWKKPATHIGEIIPVQIGAEYESTENRHIYRDRSQNDEVTIYELCKADRTQTEKVVKIACDDRGGWRDKASDERRTILYAAANNLAHMRGDLIGCMCAVTGKTLAEGDIEVSEAIDFTRYYPDSLQKFQNLSCVEMKPKGVILVISPWNFPCAIPVGGITAALSAGNTVILKPATVAAPVASLFARAFWEAGVPKEALQVVVPDGEALETLTTDPRISHIILTGGTDTAQKIARINPMTPLSAETGGKNAIILTASGDRDHAILNTVASAFGNSGQKCSACSLLLVEASVYDDPSFRSKLFDAASSISAGGVWNTEYTVGPMITNTNDDLLQAINNLEPGEEWLVPPRFVDEKKYILSPCVKWGVRPGSFTFRTELFGPLLSVVRIANLKEGIELVNSLPYGLTSGLQSIDESEQALWKNSLRAGNLYINRGITGAIVGRQPFGGMKLSAFGGGIKAGGPNYVATLMSFIDKSTEDFMQNYSRVYGEVFSTPRDENNLYGEQNLLRYLPLERMVLRVRPEDSERSVEMVVAAASVTTTPLDVSLDPSDIRSFKVANGTLVRETDAQFIERISCYSRIRTCGADISKEIYDAAARNDIYISTAPPVSEGRVELLHYLQEQSITFEYHRYGSIAEVPSVE